MAFVILFVFKHEYYDKIEHEVSTMHKLKTMNKQRVLEYILLMPLMMLIMIVPLIVRARLLELEGLELANWTGNSIQLDYFSYYKSVAVMILSYGAFILMMLLKLFNQVEIRKSLYYIPVGIYIILTGLSYAFSEDPLVSARGFIELFQGVVVLISYMLIMVYALNVVKKDWHLLALTFAFIFVGVMVFIVGFTQYFGFDLLRTSFAHYFMFPENLAFYADNIDYRFGKYTIYGTMYNSNFVGSFAALMVPFALTLYLFVQKRLYLVLTGLFVLMMVFTGLGSNSRAGIVGVSAGLIVFVILFRARLKEKYLRTLSIFLLVIIQSVAMNVVSEGRIFGEFSKLSLSNEWERIEEIGESRVKFNDLIFEEDRILILTEAQSIAVSYNETDGYHVEDLEGNTVPMIVDEDGTFTLEGYEFSGTINQTINDEDQVTQTALLITMYHQNFAFYQGDERLMMSGTGGASEIEYPEVFSPLIGYERFASSRGYIWSRSIPLLFDQLLLGEGPGMYAISFPQHDYIGKINGLSTYSIIVDKPHNLYLQIGIETGLLSLLAFTGLFIMYTVDTLKLFLMKKIYTFRDFLGIGMFVSVISYLAAGMFNDQIVSVAPLFYVMAGLGFAVNAMVKEDRFKLPPVEIEEG